MSAINLFTAEQQQRIIAAIQKAELATSGEIRVHIEKKCSGDNPMERAIEIFGNLGMHQTAEHNGVLFYLATEDRKFAVIGDKGINERVPAGFWDSTKELLRTHFAAGNHTEGLCQGIAEAGRQLKQFFPRAHDDTNELSDEISFK
ncbi:TPM domain-containing protein [Nibrella viscosa]|uniref:TPM domain-containing protein n=1 Tax=Nibrella viscosa TaxID=1084524 RepID=A0ABP8KIW1_9BACT